MEEKKIELEKASPFLLSKGLPATEREFFLRFGISKKKAKHILDKIAEEACTKNPALQKINHSRTWSRKNLEKLFNFAGHNYQQLLKNIEEYKFQKLIPNKFIEEICKE